MGSPTTHSGQPSEDASGETHFSSPSPGPPPGRGDADISTASDSTPPPRGGPSPLIGAAIGPYLIRSVLGEGGFGVVYLAEQSVPVRRRVALKVIKPGMDTKAVIARFEAERQALAMMNHPGVAKVFDAGQTDAGRPYFVMEYVQGVGLTEHCERHRLPLHERLELFMRVCDAVQHAHQKGIIHRDLKPSNVLIQYEAGQPAPKVIDFGVAKALDQRLTERTLFTEQGQLVGTPEYMSPEQAEMSVQDIDTRTDIYSLGVILYQLITGSLPFDPETLRSEGFAGIQRIIREVEPVKPSTRLAQLAQSDVKTAEEQASRLQSDSAALRRQLRGDLDWIAMKSLEKDRARRYDTAREFAQDIERFLKHEPVLAGPPTAGYRLRKFARRNRAGLAVAGIVLVALVSATAISLRMAWIATEAQGVATKQLGEANIAREKEKNERLRADGEARRATQVAAFLQDVLAAAAKAARESESREAIKTIVDGAAEKLKAATDLDPIVKARVSLDIGRLYAQIDMHKAATAFLHGAYITFRKDTGPAAASAETREAANALARNLLERRYASFGQTAADTVDSRALMDECVAAARTAHGEKSIEYARALLVLAAQRGEGADLDAATASAATAVALMEGILGPRNEECLAARFVQARNLRASKDSSAPELERKLEADCLAALGVGHTLTTRVRLHMASVEARGSDGEPDPEVMDRLLAKLGGARSATPTALASFQADRGVALAHQRNHAQAIPLLESSLELYTETYGADSTMTLYVSVNLGLAYAESGRYGDAVMQLKDAIKRIERVYRQPDLAMWRPLQALGYTQVWLGDRQAALATLTRMRDTMLRAKPNDPAWRLDALSFYGAGLFMNGNLAEARAAADEAATLIKPELDNSHYRWLQARLAAEDGRWADALSHARRRVDIASRNKVPPIQEWGLLVFIHERAGELDEAVKANLERLRHVRQRDGEQAESARQVARDLARLFRKQGNTAMAVRLSSQLDAGALPPTDHIGVDIDRLFTEARAAINLGKHADAQAILERLAPVMAALELQMYTREDYTRLYSSVLLSRKETEKAVGVTRRFADERLTWLGGDHYATLAAIQMHLDMLARARDIPSALKALGEYRQTFTTQYGERSAALCRLLLHAQNAFHRNGGWEHALALLEEARGILTANPPVAMRYDFLAGFGRVCLRLKKLDDAEAAMLEGIRLQAASNHRSYNFPVQWFYFDLSQVYRERGDRDKQLANLRKANELFVESGDGSESRWADNTRNDLVALLKSMDRHDDARRVTLGQPWSLTPGGTPVAKLPPPTLKMTLDHRLSAAAELVKAGKLQAALDELAKLPAGLGDAKVTVNQLRVARDILQSLRLAARGESPVLKPDALVARVVALMTSLDLAGYESPVDAEVERAEIAMTLILLGSHVQAEAIVERAIRVITEQAGENDRRLFVPHHRMAQSFAYRGLGKKAEPHADKAVALLKATEPNWDAPAGRRWYWSDMALVYEQVGRWSDAAAALGLLCDDDRHWNQAGPPRNETTLRYVRTGNHLIKTALDAGKADEAKMWVAKLKPQIPVIDAQSAEAKTFQELVARVGP